ncbi:TPA: hypothetical protein ACYLN4_004563 [Burkholderia lata]|uniref:hypothetical protein n=1 Tax=Burkholderia aenigmatica TaxID=2015348 RepID=UPI003C6C73AD
MDERPNDDTLEILACARLENVSTDPVHERSMHGMLDKTRRSTQVKPDGSADRRAVRRHAEQRVPHRIHASITQATHFFTYVESTTRKQQR